jgi:putative hydrolase of the HAD superfamily
MSKVFPAKKTAEVMRPIQRYDLKTFDWVSQIGVVVWDVDKTLYQQIPQLNRDIEHQLVKQVGTKHQLSDKKARALFNQHFAQLHSTTMTLNKLGFDGKKTLNQIMKQTKLTNYLKPDDRLKKLITQLPQFHHVILSNATSSSTKEKLKALGLPAKLFSAIYGAYDLPIVKPDPGIFQYIINQTGFAPHQHLAVGDEVEKDLLPAKSVGMHTALVWSHDPRADVSFDQVYGVGRLFGVEV